MSAITIEIPDDTLVELFELGRLSSGVAARLAGVPRVVFLSLLADYGVDTFCLTGEDLDKETRLA